MATLYNSQVVKEYNTKLASDLTQVLNQYVHQWTMQTFSTSVSTNFVKQGKLFCLNDGSSPRESVKDKMFTSEEIAKGRVEMC